MAQDIIANTLSVDNIEAKTLKIDNQPFQAKASTTTLGGVKIGNGINIDADGKISIKIWYADYSGGVLELGDDAKPGDIVMVGGADNSHDPINKIIYKNMELTPDNGNLNGGFISNIYNPEPGVCQICFISGNQVLSFTPA